MRSYSFMYVVHYKALFNYFLFCLLVFLLFSDKNGPGIATLLVLLVPLPRMGQFLHRCQNHLYQDLILFTIREIMMW